MTTTKKSETKKSKKNEVIEELKNVLKKFFAIDESKKMESHISEADKEKDPEWMHTRTKLNS